MNCGIIMNYCTTATADRGLPCTPEQFEAIRQAMDLEDAEDIDAYHGMEVVYLAGELYLKGEEFANPEALPDIALELLGALITTSPGTNGIQEPHLAIGVSYSAGRAVAGSQGGTTYLLFPDGELVEPVVCYTRKGVRHCQ